MLAKLIENKSTQIYPYKFYSNSILGLQKQIEEKWIEALMLSLINLSASIWGFWIWFENLLKKLKNRKLIKLEEINAKV